MGYTALQRISDGLGWEFERDPMPDSPLQLTKEEFTAAVALLHDVGFTTERDAEEAWPHFRGWRVNYENLAYRWADRVLAPPAPWSGTRTGLEIIAVMAFLGVVLMQRNFLDLAYNDPVPNVMVPTWALTAYFTARLARAQPCPTDETAAP